MNEDNTMIIYDSEGNEHLATILFTYHHDERNKDYVVFYLNSDPDNVMAMTYNEEGELVDIEDEEEFNEVSEVYDAFMDEEEQ